MDIVNEKTTYRIVVEFIAEDGAPVIPTFVTYQIDDVLSDENVLSSRSFVPSGSQYVITIPYSSNRVINSNNDTEERSITVVAIYGVGKQCTGEYRYKVRNLLKVT